MTYRHDLVALLVVCIRVETATARRVALLLMAYNLCRSSGYGRLLLCYQPGKILLNAEMFRGLMVQLAGGGPAVLALLTVASAPFSRIDLPSLDFRNL
jgi:hypothetical protein